ncbi:MAG: hypothetical protein AAFY02_14205 [Pseudomonadota bacterium]
MKDAGVKETDGGVALAESNTNGIPESGTPTFDPQRYRPHLDGCDDLTAEQADRLLLSLWEIMKGFVYLGWGVDSVHQVLPDLAAIASDIEAAELDSEDAKLLNQFEHVTAASGTKGEQS